MGLGVVVMGAAAEAAHSVLVLGWCRLLVVGAVVAAVAEGNERLQAAAQDQTPVAVTPSIARGQSPVVLSPRQHCERRSKISKRRQP